MVLCVLLCTCREQEPYTEITGKIFGTSYTIKSDVPLIRVQSQIDSILNVVDYELSTYKKSSYISLVNQASSGDTLGDWPIHFMINLKKAIEIYEASDQYYDVSVMPLVNYWGFGYTPKKAVSAMDSTNVDTLMRYVGLDKWYIDLIELKLVKTYTEQQLDFSSLAKGYAVDIISQWLIDQGSQHHMVEIGGEIVVRGFNAKGKEWSLGVNVPDEDAAVTDFISTVSISDKAMASSGNYRNFYEVEGRKYGHTINPKTGYPYQDELLAVTVIANDCMTADAIATACMAMGFERANQFVSTLPSVEALFLVGQADGSITEKLTDGFIQYQQ